MKIRCLYIACFLLFFNVGVSAQNNKVDSLLQIAKSAGSSEESSKAYIDLSQHYRYISLDTALLFSQKALTIAQKIGHKRKICQALLCMGASYFMLEQDSIALYYYNKSLSIAERENYEAEKGSVLGNMGGVYINRGDYNQAIKLFKRALEIDRKSNDKSGQAGILSNLAIAALLQDDYKRGAEYLFQGIELMKEEGDMEGVALSYNNLAKIYQDQKEYEKSLIYLLEAESILEKANQIGILKMVCSNLGEVYTHLDSNEKAIEHYRKAIHYGELTQGPCTNQKTLLSLSKIFLNTGKLDSAALIAREVVSKASTCSEDEGLTAVAYWVLSRVESEKGNWDQAEKEALKSFNLVAGYNTHKDQRSSGAKLLSDIYKHKKDYKKAFYYLEVYHQLQDSILNESNLQEVARLEAEHKFQLEKQALEAENRENSSVLETKVKAEKNLRNYILVFGALAVVLMFFFYRLATARKKINKELEEKNRTVVEQKQKIEEANNELLTLSENKEFFTQMVAHDLKNPLNTISVFSSLLPPSQNSKNIAQASNQMIRLVSNLLDVRRFENNKFTLHPIDIQLKEVVTEAVNRCVYLLQTKSITVNIQVQEALIVNADKDLLVRVFENLITNAAKYSKAGKTIGVSAHIQETGRTVEIKVADSGYGIEKDHLQLIFNKYWQLKTADSKISASMGLGLAFCKLVIEAHNGAIEADSEINEGTTFTITLPNGKISGEVFGQETLVSIMEGEIIPAELKNHEEVIACFNRMKTLKVFQAGRISEMLDKLEKYKINEVWKSRVLTAVFNGDQKEYDNLLTHI